MVLASEGAAAPVLATGAGHDAGILATTVPTAMIFARNPTGVSHSPHEHASEDDCVAGIAALSVTLENLLTGLAFLSFEESGAYRLLLPAMSEDPAELERFYAETVEPLVAYDEQYETELVATVEAYLDNDGNVAATAKQLFTHRHTVRYRLERVKELCGHDVSATEGREKLGLGLKAMRVDPALASSVFITTFTDVVGFASFLGFATIFLRYLTAQ